MLSNHSAPSSPDVPGAGASALAAVPDGPISLSVTTFAGPTSVASKRCCRGVSPAGRWLSAAISPTRRW